MTKFAASQHLQSLIGMSIMNSIVEIGPDKQWQQFEASHFWAHLAFVIFVNAWAGIVPYLRASGREPKNLIAPAEPAKEQQQ
jgi:hypothetical protein